MALDISVKLGHVNDVSIGRVLAGFEDENGKMQAGRIKVDGKIYEVKFLEGGTAEVRRNYQGVFGWLRNRYCHKDTTRALALQGKINDVLAQSETKEFKILSNTHQKLLGLLKSSKDAEIEVANYGFESNRGLVAKSFLVPSMNEKLKSEGRAIKFNKIDDYNSLVGINASSIDPREFPEMMEKIAGGTLRARIPDGYDDNFTKQDLADWKAFLAKPENVAKIDIPGKLYRYMHLPEGHQATKQTGWEASFAHDKAAAMRSFVLKNLSYGARDLSSETIDLLAAKLTRYVEICAVKDKAQRDALMGEFFAKANWLTPGEQVKFDNLVSKVGPNAANSMLEKKTLDERKLFNAFRNILSVAFFRQTSKLGLDFLRDKGTPVLFQFSDYSGRSYVGREQELFQPEAWRQDEETAEYREKGGSAITSSEMRHAIRMGEDTTVELVGGV